jgi:PleD family two-component response regulator
MDDLKKEEKDGGCSITVSVGMIEIDEHLGMDQLIRKADEVLYVPTENGRDQITAFMSESNRHQY